MGTALLTAGIGAVGSIISGNAVASGYSEASAVQGKQLDFDKDRYDDWKAVYGTLQEDMGEYYKNLTGETISTKEIQKIQLASQKAEEQISKQLSQRGLDGSGLQAQLLSDNTYKTAMQKASVRANSEQMANEARMKFLSVGLGQGNAIAGSMAQTSANMANTAIGAGNARGTTIGTTTGAIVGGIQQYNSSVGG